MSKSPSGNILKVGTWRTHKDGNGFREIKEGIAPTIPARAREDGSGQPVVSYSMGSSKPGRSCINAQRVPEIGNEEKSIRRLTEIECERLQGFQDNWTEYGDYDGTIKKIPKTQRYKMLGNAVTVNVVKEVAKRIILLNNNH